MRIVFDARYLGGKASGVGTYGGNLLRAMLAQAPELRPLLVVRRKGVAAMFDTSRCTEIVFPFPPRSQATLHLLPLVLCGRGFDLFHGPFNILPSHMAAPSVVTVHDVMQLQNPANIATSAFVRHTAGRFWRKRIAHAVRHAGRVLAVSQATRDAILERFAEVPAARVVVTPNGTDPYYAEPATAAELAAARARIGTDAPFILCIGNESPHKNHHRAVEAFLAAFGGTAMRMVLVRRSVRHDPRMAALLARPDVAAQVIVLPHIAGAELRALYTLARVHFFPSWVEGFGLPILEGMACGCPTLTADRSAPAEVAGDAALTVNPFDVAAMADALRRLDTDETLRRALAEKGRARVRDFTWENCARVTLDAYRSLLAG